MYVNDQPITNTNNLEDEFNRENLANGIARVLEQCDVKHGSMTISIEGSWGSGKTSLKNLVIRQLERHWQDNAAKAHEQSEKEGSEETQIPSYPLCVPFDPWMFSDASNVVEMMFATIAGRLEDKSELEQTREQRRKNRLETAAKISGEAVEAVGAFASYIPNAAPLAWGFKQISKLLKPDPESPLQLTEIREQLSHELEYKASDLRIYVFIDEIDRLDDQGIADIFKALKAVGDLPHVVYIPVYDRTIVSEALNKVSNHSGSDYLDKIVQMPIPMPEVPFEVIIRNLKIACGFDDTQLEKRPWQKDIVEKTVLAYVKNKRDANRLQNAFLLRKQVLAGEVDYGDLFAITAISIFRPSLLRWIYMHKDALLDSGALVAKEISKQTRKVSIRVNAEDSDLADHYNLLKEEIDDVSYWREGLALELLFPVSHYMKKVNPESHRIASAQSFDVYFTLTSESRTAVSSETIKQYVLLYDLTRLQEDTFIKLPHNQIASWINAKQSSGAHEIPMARIEQLLEVYQRFYGSVIEDERDWANEFPRSISHTGYEKLNPAIPANRVIAELLRSFPIDERQTHIFTCIDLLTSRHQSVPGYDLILRLTSLIGEITDDDDKQNHSYVENMLDRLSMNKWLYQANGIDLSLVLNAFTEIDVSGVRRALSKLSATQLLEIGNNCEKTVPSTYYSDPRPDDLRYQVPVELLIELWKHMDAWSEPSSHDNLTLRALKEWIQEGPKNATALPEDWYSSPTRYKEIVGQDGEGWDIAEVPDSHPAEAE
ncbi:hypothetical protein CS006_02480 [Bifidobacterium primatium]|uniref:KAP NTPase domain-containing protein n=1 Tax=Bifidobacterium primatium TaxID=2045438 RepID=A0A2M9HB68_9BIFI|nr:P-loop NTPase fold protein [Bifidobacterium primatium]PJM74031.1 hypothetical protein CS006_02480 [Bifidobacterium primatium]